MAGGAGGRPAGGDMVGIGGAGEVRFVAGIAIGRCAGKDVIDVAEIAGDGDVGAGEREGRVVVVEGCAGPRGCGVACVAGGGESRCGMGGVGGAVPVCLMAAVAGCGQGCVVVIGVALSAGQRSMCAGERECSVVVVEGRGAPAAGGVADGAVGGEAGGDVIGVGGAVEISLMAGVAGGGSGCVAVVGVALDAGERGVNAGERIVGVDGVIEVDGRPVGCVVAGVAGGGESSRSMSRVGGSVPVCLVTAEAGGGQSCVVVIGVALDAGQRGVCAGQRKDYVVIKGG